MWYMIKFYFWCGGGGVQDISSIHEFNLWNISSKMHSFLNIARKRSKKYNLSCYYNKEKWLKYLLIQYDQILAI